MRQEMGVMAIHDAIKLDRLRWFGHVKRREKGIWVKRCMEMEIEGRNPKGCPKRPGDRSLAAHPTRWCHLKAQPVETPGKPQPTQVRRYHADQQKHSVPSGPSCTTPGLLPVMHHVACSITCLQRGPGFDKQVEKFSLWHIP